MRQYLKSMTGYGQAHFEDKDICLHAAVKTINAKQVDVTLRLPKAFAAQEMACRNLVIAQLVRGKVAVQITCEHKNLDKPTTNINPALFKAYYHTLQGLAQAVGATDDFSPTLYQLALQSPEVMTKADYEHSIQKADERLLYDVLHEALLQCTQSRQAEGTALANKLWGYLAAIRKKLTQIEQLDPGRNAALRKKLQTGLKAVVSSDAIDQNRLEQELLYYIERIDITEEKVRLEQHISYFEETMQDEHPVGKKLGFIAQEMGREINTIGAKANDVAIQKNVILMKETLEKIKEQLCNVL